MRCTASVLILFATACSFDGGLPAVGADAGADAEPACVPLPSGLIGWWDGEELGVDTTGNHSAAVLGSPQVVPGHVGNAIRFDNQNGVAATDMIEVTLLTQPAAFTIEGWVYLDRFHQGWISIFGRMSDACFALYEHSVTFWEADVRSGGVNGNVALQSGALGTATWHHVAFTYDGADATTYANGVVVGTETVVDVELIEGSAGIGGAPGGMLPVQDGMTGLVDELTLYNRALTADEVAAIASAGSAGKCKTP